MKAFLCKKVLKTLSLIFVMSLLLGLLVPFSAVELAEDESDVAQGAADIKPYVVFDGEAIKDGRITGKHQGEYQFIEEDSTFLRFEADYSKTPIDPSVTFTPGGSYSADVYKYVSIVVRTKGASSSLDFWLYYIAGEGSGFSKDCVVSSQYATTDDWQIVTFNLSSIASL